MTDELDDRLSDVGVDMLEIIVMTFVVGVVAETVVVLTDLLTVVIIVAVSVTDADMLADENASSLAAVMTPLEFTLSAPWEESMSLC